MRAEILDLVGVGPIDASGVIFFTPRDWIVVYIRASNATWYVKMKYLSYRCGVVTAFFEDLGEGSYIRYCASKPVM